MTFTLPRNAELWLPAYLRHQAATWLRRSPGKTIDVLLCVADHYEPDHGGASMSKEIERVERWSTRYPALADCFRDADGRPPQHTFFFPADGYRPAHLDRLAQLCQAGYGEVEVHLHHGHDTSAKLRDTLEQYRDTLANRHGLLSTDRGGRTRYAFIHGNWALDNGGLDASTCGVNDELTILRETGCYADLTMPAAPNPAQMPNRQQNLLRSRRSREASVLRHWRAQSRARHSSRRLAAACSRSFGADMEIGTVDARLGERRAGRVGGASADR